MEKDHLFLVEHDPQLVVRDPHALPQLLVLVLHPDEVRVGELLPGFGEGRSLLLQLLGEGRDLSSQLV